MTLGEFRALLLGRLNRNDCTTDLADGFILEAIERIEREVRAPFMERSLQLTAGPGGLASFPRPADYIEGFEVIANGRPLRRLAYRLFLRERNSAPSVYTRYGDTIRIDGALPEGGVLDFLYYGKFVWPANDGATNALLTEAHTLALYAALSTAGDHFQHEKTPEWEARYASTREGVQMQAIEDEMRGGPQAVAPIYTDPGA